VTNVVADICFALDSIDGAALAEIVREHDLGFRATRVETDTWKARAGAKALERLAASGRIATAELTDTDYDHNFGAYRMAGVMQHLSWHPEDPAVLRPAIEAITRRPGFSAAYLSDLDDASWQSETFISNYESFGRPHEHLRKRPGGLTPGETESIDISEHWGRMVATEGLWLWAASSMWFGAGAFERLDRERLRALPVGEVTEREDGIVRVELFPIEWFETALEQARERQRAFWGWMDLASLEPDLAPSDGV
jgi:hypothetical protein